MLRLVEKGPKKDLNLIIFNLHQRIRYKVFCHVVARKVTTGPTDAKKVQIPRENRATKATPSGNLANL